MNHRTGLDRSQTLLFPERLEDYVAAENPVRFLDPFVWMLYCRNNINYDRGLFCRNDFVHQKSDDPGQQPQTGAEPGKLRETDASGGDESAAKRLNRGGGPFFPFVGDAILPDGYLYELNLWKTKPAI